MRDPMIRVCLSCSLLLTLVIGSSFGQSRKAFVCKKSALVALRPMPALTYPCDGQPNDWDEAILKLPARRTAINALISQLSSFSDPVWWATDTTDLNVCDFTREAGPLTPDRRQSFLDGEYLFWLFGNDRIRLVLIPDPCYQTEYGGANAFLLYRKGGRVFTTQVLNGYFSRADNSINIAFARLGKEEIIEISTGTGGLNPTLTNYYFVIDPRTNQAVPKNLFKRGRRVTNEISSAMLFGESSAPLKIMRANRLTKSFTIYTDDSRGTIDDNGRTLSRRLLRWDGKLYR